MLWHFIVNIKTLLTTSHLTLQLPSSHFKIGYFKTNHRGRSQRGNFALNVDCRWTCFNFAILDKQPKTDNFSEYICTFTEADGGTTIYKSHQLTIANPVTRAASRSGCELFVSGGAKSQLTQRETMCVAETHKTCRKSKSSLKTYFTQTSTDHTAVS